MADKFYVTTPIYYVNARPHIGHAYTTIVADVLARRHRLLGEDVFFLTGTDEHGQKIERSAAARGIAPQEFADEVSASFRSLWQRMGITNDAYIRTTDAAHKRGVQKLFAELYDHGQIYLSSYTGQYSIGEEMFVEGPPGTIGPDGKPTETVTEENFFFRLSDYQLPLLDLIESDTLKITPESRRNEVLSFLRGDAFKTAVDAAATSLQESPIPENGRELIADHAVRTGHLKRSAAGTPYVPGALKDLSVSRSSFTWGIPVPEPAASEAKEKHVIYVWLDALANYMTALGYGSENPEEQANFEHFWPADLHLVGKEIIRFHCVYWPAFLLALNPALKHAPGTPAPNLTPAEHAEWAKKWLPKAVTAHGWLLFEDSKMSKSKGNIVRTETILEAFGTLCPPPPSTPSTDVEDKNTTATDAVDKTTSPTHVLLKGTASAVPQTSTENGASAPEVGSLPTPHDRDLFAADVLRYFLLREIPFGQDGSFSFDAMITRYNADLANGYGNLVSRTLKLIQQNCDAAIPAHEPFGQFEIHLADSIPRSGQVNALKGMLKIEVHGPRLAGDAVAAILFYEEAFPALRFSSYFDPDLAKVTKAGVIDSVAFLVTQTDGFLTAEAPWKLAKQGTLEAKCKVAHILYTAAESIRIITALLHPILPYATANVWRQLGLGDITQADLKDLQWGGLQPGTKLGPLGPIFPRADKGLAQIMSDMEAAKTLEQANAAHDATPEPRSEFGEAPIASEAGKPVPSKLVDETFAAPAATGDPTDPGAGPRTGTFAEANPGATVGGSAAVTTERPGTPPHAEAAASGIFAGQPADSSPQITIDDFAKVELRIAKVIVCERIPKADKLLRLEVDLGYEKRQILSGIAEWYTPEDLLGRRIVVITNLAPRKMRGLESHGMLLAASSEGGKPALATFLDSDELPLGSRLK